jgi:predicted RNase H-like HicB family nuclease
MMEKRLMYPVIISEFNDEDGHYFVATTPNIPGMVTQGATFSDAAYWAEDAIATMLEGESTYPKVQNPTEWEIKENDRIVYIAVDMKKWMKKHTKTVKKTITVPEYLSNMAKEQNINVSRLTTEALQQKLGF